jgi:mannose-6-phosphate isomerase-like protein (cupin superfamily)
MDSESDSEPSEAMDFAEMTEIYRLMQNDYLKDKENEMIAKGYMKVYDEMDEIMRINEYIQNYIDNDLRRFYNEYIENEKAIPRGFWDESSSELKKLFHLEDKIYIKDIRMRDWGEDGIGFMKEDIDNGRIRNRYHPAFVWRNMILSDKKKPKVIGLDITNMMNFENMRPFPKSYHGKIYTVYKSLRKSQIGIQNQTHYFTIWEFLLENRNRIEDNLKKMIAYYIMFYGYHQRMEWYNEEDQKKAIQIFMALRIQYFSQAYSYYRYMDQYFFPWMIDFFDETKAIFKNLIDVISISEASKENIAELQNYMNELQEHKKTMDKISSKDYEKEIDKLEEINRLRNKINRLQKEIDFTRRAIKPKWLKTLSEEVSEYKKSMNLSEDKTEEYDLEDLMKSLHLEDSDVKGEIKGHEYIIDHPLYGEIAGSFLIQHYPPEGEFESEMDGIVENIGMPLPNRNRKAFNKWASQQADIYKKNPKKWNGWFKTQMKAFINQLKTASTEKLQARKRGDTEREGEWDKKLKDTSRKISILKKMKAYFEQKYNTKYAGENLSDNLEDVHLVSALMAPEWINLRRLTLQNEEYQFIHDYTPQSKLVLMSVHPRGIITEEEHKKATQFIRVERGVASIYSDTFPEGIDIHEGEYMFIEPGETHEIANESEYESLKLYSIYSTPERTGKYNEKESVGKVESMKRRNI